MAKAKIKKLPLISSQITASVSVALVLLLLGMVAMLGLAARNITRQVKEDVGFTVVLSEGVSPEQIERLASDLDGMEAVREARFVSADTVLARWQEMQGPDAENVMDLLGVNPFTAEFDVSVTEAYASTDSILRLTEGMLDNPAVVEISMSNEMIDSLNSTVKSLSLVMVIVALALLVISFILINNT
ncbi:MAG: permease-like cell division protein FtsX, partial [Paramuribaculum sp.]|nr:permease-like cell division protein FtsX [Paramuribaculum sp.]